MELVLAFCRARVFTIVFASPNKVKRLRVYVCVCVRLHNGLRKICMRECMWGNTAIATQPLRV